MSDLSVSFTFSPNTTAASSQVNTNFSDIVTYINNRDDGTATWDNLNVTATVANPVTIKSSAATTEVAIDNTATDGDPEVTFKLTGVAKFAMGVDDSDSDKFKLSASGALGTTDVLSCTTAGAFSIVSSTDTNITGANLNVVRSASGATVGYVADQQSNTASSNALFYASVAGTSAGDPFISFVITSGASWSIGNDNSDSDKFKISRSTALGTSDIVTLDATSFDPVGAGAIDSGDASNYWADISYKTLTDRGCLGWFDEGVELQDGRKVSDTEAILSIEKDETKDTIYGVPMLKYSTFPKVAFRKASANGIELPRDVKGEPVGGSDGIEMTSMFSIMIGAIKELTNRVKVLES